MVFNGLTTVENEILLRLRRPMSIKMFEQPFVIMKTVSYNCQKLKQRYTPLLM